MLITAMLPTVLMSAPSITTAKCATTRHFLTTANGQPAAHRTAAEGQDRKDGPNRRIRMQQWPPCAWKSQHVLLKTSVNCKPIVRRVFVPTVASACGVRMSPSASLSQLTYTSIPTGNVWSGAMMATVRALIARPTGLAVPVKTTQHADGVMMVPIPDWVLACEVQTKVLVT